ncbi:hypothetical protein ABE096_04690 [Robertmurraya massiliosenegalensis]|uniref:hypothetical protein n=1 Tax=Robertmurraya TaxID=2837507 RepID=UPI0039A6653E
MNIQQFYRSAATTSLNGSIAALIPVIILIIPLTILIPGKEVVWTALPFFLYSISSFQSYLLNQERSSQIEGNLHIGENHLSFHRENEFLLTFMPAPSLRLLLFSPKGVVLGELRDVRYTKLRWFLPYFLDKFIPAEYGFYNAENQLMMKFKWKRNQGNVYDRNGKLQMTIQEREGEVFDVILPHSSFPIMIHSERLFTDVQFKNMKKKTIGRVRKGWMPIEWEELFKDVNIPVFSFDDELTEEERYVLLALLVKIYRYRNH